MANRESSMDMSELERELEEQLAGSGISGEATDTGIGTLETDEEEDWPSNGREVDLPAVADYGTRFQELASREFESEGEADAAIGEILNDMEQDYFFGKLMKRIKKGGLKGLLSKGLSFAAGQFPALQGLKAVTQLTRGNMKGLLGSLAKAGLASAFPGGAAALPALQALGFESEEDTHNSEAWSRFVNVAREAYENLADDLHEAADRPEEAARVASTAVQNALRRARGVAPAPNGSPRGARRIAARRGDTIMIRVV